MHQRQYGELALAEPDRMAEMGHHWEEELLIGIEPARLGDGRQSARPGCSPGVLQEDRRRTQFTVRRRLARLVVATGTRNVSQGHIQNISDALIRCPGRQAAIARLRDGRLADQR
jgi:hypothetical protein